MFFPGFTERRVAVPRGLLRLRMGGSGPPALLLHGNPQTHAMWHAVAPALAARFTVICPDLPGYGLSFTPPPAPDHAPHAKRAMAADLVALMDALGFPGSFTIIAHDRGARVGHRMALDHPARVARLCVMDIVPTLEHFERTDFAFAMGYYHWFFLAQPAPFPELLINRAPEDWFRAQTGREPKDDDFFHPLARADYLAAVHDPATITAICEDYRAAATIDLVHDRASRAAGQRIACPVLALWGAKGRVHQWYDVLSLWRTYADGPVTGFPVPSGHYLAEEAPEAVLAALAGFV